MTNQTQKLYWTADSPFCRIVLWAWAESAALNGTHLVHLSWNELKDSSISEVLAAERTVPCLVDEHLRLSDSLRILARLNPQAFTHWLTSDDGALFRCSEGQLGRIMYALYDGVADDTFRGKWLDAIRAIDHLLSRDSKRADDKRVLWGQMAAHTFLTFCLNFRPEWRKDLPQSVLQRMKEMETTNSFKELKGYLSNHLYCVPCVAFSD